VDKVQFLAKAGRFYRILTSDLAIGVDTALKVQAGGAIYTNDDRQPGDLSSEVAFQVPAGSDVQAIVTVTNRGQYSPDRLYNTTVEEIIPTPTHTPSPTATSTNTATPTSTPLPTATLTSTPVLSGTTSSRTTGSTVGADAYPVALNSLRLISGFALPALFYPAQTVAGHPIPHPVSWTSMNERRLPADTQVVEFVLVLELKR
jgi:hypothetical protein